MMGAFAAGLGIVFAIAVTGAGIKGCVMDKNPDNESWPALFARHATNSVMDVATAVGGAVTKKAEDPEVRESVKEGTKKTLKVGEELIKSTLQGTKEYLDNYNEEQRRKREEQQQPAPENP